MHKSDRQSLAGDSGTAPASALVACAGVAALLTLVGMLAPATARAQTDEIQVYDAHVADPGVVNLTWHNNFVAHGSREPEFSGALASDGTVNGVPEWALGITPWFEAGLYLPVYSISHGSLLFDGFKVRTLFVVPHAETRRFFYGVNFEFSYNASHWDEHRYTQEIRPILGWHLGRYDLIFNPILDNSYEGVGSLDFAPSTRLAYNLSHGWAVAVEEYADLGPIHHLLPASQQAHSAFAVADYSGHGWSVEIGLGAGLTRTADARVAKLMFSFDLN